MENRSEDELRAIEEAETEFQKIKRDGGGNPLVEALVYVVFISRRQFGKPRKHPVTVELVGVRGSKQRYPIVENALPQQLQRFSEIELGTDSYNEVLEKLRMSGRR